MQSAGLAQDVESRTKVEMVGVAQDDLCLHLFAELGEVYGLHAAHRSDGHEDRCLNLSVIGGDDARPRLTRIIAMLYLESHSNIFLSHT